ncbi:MAG: hypothetical protein V9F04_16880 [Dermatophilaceae bacterium]
MDWLTDPKVWSALVTLTALEVVLGVDNVIFISILAGKLPAEQQGRARQTGLLLALVTRILLLLSISWIVRLGSQLLSRSLADVISSGRDLILLAGGLFLLGEEHARNPRAVWRATRATPARRSAASFAQRARADRAARRGLLARLGDHRRGHGRRQCGVMIAAVD